MVRVSRLPCPDRINQFFVKITGSNLEKSYSDPSAVLGLHFNETSERIGYFNKRWRHKVLNLRVRFGFVNCTPQCYTPQPLV